VPVSAAVRVASKRFAHQASLSCEIREHGVTESCANDGMANARIAAAEITVPNDAEFFMVAIFPLTVLQGI
jgi:hypothetical protein